MDSIETHAKQLGQQTPLPASPEAAQLDRVPNPHADTDYLARFTAPEFTSLCPVTGQPDAQPARFEQCDEPPPDADGAILVEGAVIAEGAEVELQRFRLHEPAIRHVVDDERRDCASAATGIRAAAFRSTCSGRRVSP
jgi:hypothetical protein